MRAVKTSIASATLLAALLALSEPAAALEKCVGADGKISYMDRCPAGTRAPAKTDEQLIPKAHSAPVITKPELEPLQNVMKPAPPTDAPKPAAAVVVPTVAPTPAPAPSPVLTAAPADVKVDYYDVQGSDHASLMSALNARSAGHAQSSWKLAYQYQPRREKGLCGAGSITTKLELAMTLPRWTPPAGAPQDLADRWARYVNALVAHENARLDHAREMERALKPSLLEVPPMDCAALDAAVAERYNTMREEVRARETKSSVPQPLVFE
jgi:predicted secreted Zn-dependent protease